MTDEQGNAAWQWKYSAFGEEKPTRAAQRFVDTEKTPGMGTGSVGDVTFSLRYPGQYADGESGLFYNYFRSYDARTGRYSQADPIGLEGGWNRFSYVEGQPLGRSDPRGLFSVQEWWDASLAGFQAEGPLDSLMRGLQGLPGEGVVAGSIGGAAKMFGLMCSTGARASKAINLPGWSKISVDMAHIAERHMAGGKLVEGRSVFVNLSERSVEAAVRQAYGTGRTISVQGDRVLLYGETKTGMAVEMWFNRATSTIETAYPVIPR